MSAFLREVTSLGNARFDGSQEDLLKLAHEHFENNEPGTGSVDGDVLLVNVPSAGFRTNIAPITADNAFQVEIVETTRVSGEAAVPLLTIYTDEDFPPANFVKLVLYRADVLERDSDRASYAEWELVAINAQPEEDTPMHPETMKRNALDQVGGTLREYTDEEWERAKAYWSLHAYLRKL